MPFGCPILLIVFQHFKYNRHFLVLFILETTFIRFGESLSLRQLLYTLVKVSVTRLEPFFDKILVSQLSSLQCESVEKKERGQKVWWFPPSSTLFASTTCTIGTLAVLFFFSIYKSTQEIQNIREISQHTSREKIQIIKSSKSIVFTIYL